MKPLCIYVASRLSTIPPQLQGTQLTNANVILGYIYNLKESLKAAAEVWRKGHYPFVPGYDFLLYLELDTPTPQLPYGAGLEWVRRSDAILIVNGLEDSKGVQREYKVACEEDKILFFSVDQIPEVDE